MEKSKKSKKCGVDELRKADKRAEIFTNPRSETKKYMAQSFTRIMGQTWKVPPNLNVPRKKQYFAKSFRNVMCRRDL